MNPDAETTLREKGTAISATTAETAIELDPTAFDDAIFAVLIAGDYSSYVAGSAFWNISIETCPTASGTFTPIGSLSLSGTAGIVPIPLSGFLAEYKDPTAQYVRVRAVKTGSPGTLDYTCFLSPE
jgi:hypothetical protein